MFNGEILIEEKLGSFKMGLRFTIWTQSRDNGR